LFSLLVFAHDPGTTAEGQSLQQKVVASSAHPVLAADIDFAARCHAPGVVKCVAFDLPSDLIPDRNIFPDGNGAMQYALDKDILIRRPT
jgi:hypothetical protein